MSILKIESFEIKVSDFFTTDSSIILDLHFDSDENLKRFYDFYKKAFFNSVNYSCAEVNGTGYLGFFIYDAEHNSRLYITSEPNESFSQKNVLTYNLTPLLRNFEKRISTITSILCEKGLLSNEEANQLSSYLYPCNENMDMEHQVENVQQYLSDTKSTIQETKAFFNPKEKDSSQ